MTLAFSLNRTIEIGARRATVFRFFTDSARWARWWGDGSSIEPRVGGAVKIRYPDGTTASGVVRELEPDRAIAFSYGYDDPDKPIAPGGSLVTNRHMRPYLQEVVPLTLHEGSRADFDAACAALKTK